MAHPICDSYVCSHSRGGHLPRRSLLVHPMGYGHSRHGRAATHIRQLLTRLIEPTLHPNTWLRCLLPRTPCRNDCFEFLTSICWLSSLGLLGYRFCAILWTLVCTLDSYSARGQNSTHDGDWQGNGIRPRLCGDYVSRNSNAYESMDREHPTIESRLQVTRFGKHTEIDHRGGSLVPDS